MKSGAPTGTILLATEHVGVQRHLMMQHGKSGHVPIRSAHKTALVSELIYDLSVTFKRCSTKASTAVRLISDTYISCSRLLVTAPDAFSRSGELTPSLTLVSVSASLCRAKRYFVVHVSDSTTLHF